MSVYLYSGTPGSGKSYEAVNVVFKNLKKGIDVIANFAVKFDAKTKKYEKNFLYMENKYITVFSLYSIARHRGYLEKKKEHQCIVVIDEAGGKYNCRKAMVKDEREDMNDWIDFFSQHMKMGFDFILIAQMDRMLDKQIRGIIETEYKFRKLTLGNMINMMPFISILVLLPFLLPFLIFNKTLFLKVEFWYHVSKRSLGCSIIKYKTKNAERYDRFKMFEGFAMTDVMQRVYDRHGVYGQENSIDTIYVDVAAHDGPAA